LVALVLLNIAHTQPKGVQTYDDAYYYADSIARLGIPATIGDEYAPRAANQHTKFETTLLKGVSSTPMVSQVSISPDSQSFKVDAGALALMQDSTFDYPGWTVLIDDRQVATSPASDSGQITFNLPAGTHNVSVELRPTPIRRWSYYLSLATASLIGLILMFARFAVPSGDESMSRPIKPRAHKKARR